MQDRLTRERLEAYSKFEWIHPDSLVPAQMAAELLEARAEIAKARELIEHFVLFWFDEDDKADVLCGSFNERVLRYLASIGRLDIESDDGVRVVGRLKP